MTSPNESLEMLQTLGLNRLESEVYALLLQVAEPVTAYRIGTDLGKPTANVYKAIDALVRKGAVLTDEGATRLCRAVAPEEFLGHLRRSWDERTRQAQGVLARIGSVPPDQGIYHLQSVPLVLEKCRSMLTRCRTIAVIDAFPATLSAVLPEIRAAAERRVAVYLQTYEPCELPGAHVVCAPDAGEVLQHWKSQQLNVVTDAREVMLALLYQDLSGVHQAVWTSSLYLSCMIHGGLLREHLFQMISTRREDPDFPADLRELLAAQPFFHSTDIPGQRELFARCGIFGHPPGNGAAPEGDSP